MMWGGGRLHGASHESGGAMDGVRGRRRGTELEHRTGAAGHGLEEMGRMGIGLHRASHARGKLRGRTEGQGSGEGGGAKRAHEKGGVGQLTTVRRVDVPKGQGRGLTGGRSVQIIQQATGQGGTGEGIGSGSGTLGSGQSERTRGKIFHHVLFFLEGIKKPTWIE